MAEEQEKEVKPKTPKKRVVKAKTKKAVVVKKVEKTKFYGTGRRKSAVAKVWIKPGNGRRQVNNREAAEYFVNRLGLLNTIENPFSAVSAPSMDLRVEVFGGGVPAQADAIRMGIARALLDFNPEYRKTLRRLDLLRRDPREKERKKAGYKRARKSFQYTKR